MDETNAKYAPGSLDLSTLVEVPEIGLQIDGEWYPYAPHFRWSLLERAKFAKSYERLLEIKRIPEPTQRDAVLYATAQRDILAMACPTVPGEVWEKLPGGDVQRDAVITDFLTKSGELAMQLVPKPLLDMMALQNIANLSTGEKPSRGSRPRTADGRKSG